MAASKKTEPYGSWISPISAEMVSSNSITISEITSDGDSLYWLENRPEESGRNVIIKCSKSGDITCITPERYNVRSRVHEYGGGAYTVSNGTVYFCNSKDQRIYSITPGEEPIALTPEGNLRYADIILDKKRNRLICVCEDHNSPNQEAINSIIGITLDDDHAITSLISSRDFFSNPRLNPDQSKICWIAWDHPNMPWDGCELWLGIFDENGLILQCNLIAGGESESICQPEWSPRGDLHFISDRSGWWNPFYIKEDRQIRLCDIEAEFGRPQWVFGLSTYGFVNDSEIIFSISSSGEDELILVNKDIGNHITISKGYTEYSSIHVTNKQIYFVGSCKDRPPELVRIDLENGEVEIIRKTGSLGINNENISTGSVICFPSYEEKISFGNFYLPKNSQFTENSNEKPPLIVMIHSGPTRSASIALNMKIQFWTSRGFAVLDVNYGGSSGYGRVFRERLYGQWGIIDVNDCIKGAQYLVDKNLVDGKRMAISGGSAGGYTVLCALAFHDLFSAGVSRYGISSLKGLFLESHKFEAHYLERLIGPDHQSEELLAKRSPINFIQDIKEPVLIMQGSEDIIVPVSQSEELFNGLDNHRSAVCYVLFEGEQHGFRKSETIARAQEIELYFYSRIFNFPLAEPIEPVEIRNF